MKTNNPSEVVELSPSYRIPLFLIAGACALALVSLWLAGVCALLGLFLTIQTILIRLQFTDEALNVLRSGKVILSFPYSEWLNWEIFWSPIPILFYFREVNSIHFLPIIFDSKTLLDCLNKYYPRERKLYS
ncbi:DUF3119 family protein [Pleurocapsa sp. FMAR1]|uniref:DUF3119 family protein n=1 Tax=Pleurocapsa sp. FMAR1 TaxID=3040204 RepID=UPI0039AF63FA